MKEVNEPYQEQMRRQVNHLLTNKHVTDKEVYLISTGFFKQYSHIEHEVTHEELIREIRKTYVEEKLFERIKNHLNRLGALEYSSVEFSQQEKKELLKELKEFIQQLYQKKEKKNTFLKKIRQLFSRRKKEQNKKEKKQLRELRSYIDELEQSEKTERTHILYHKAVVLYETLEESEKIPFYNDLMGIYHSLHEEEKPHRPKKNKK